MLPSHHPPWHLHPAAATQTNKINVNGIVVYPPLSSNSSTQTNGDASATPQTNASLQNSHIERMSSEQITQISSGLAEHHAIWSAAPGIETSSNGMNSTDYSLTEMQTDEANGVIEDEEEDCKPKIKKEIKKRRKLADLLAEGIDPTKLEENSEQVKERFDKGCECDGDNCFKSMNPGFVFRHRLNIAELTKNEHDLYLMGVTMACLANPEETSRHKERKRLRASYVFQGKKVCLDAFLYLENCTHYQLKAIRKHVMVNGVTPRIHGNHGKKPPNTFPLDTYQHAAAFLQSYIARYSPNSNTPKKPNKSGKSPPLCLPADITRKKIHNAYKEYCEHFEPDVKVMGYSSFRHFMKDQFPAVRFFRVEKISERKAHSDDEDEEVLQSTSKNNGESNNGSSNSEHTGQPRQSTSQPVPTQSQPQSSGDQKNIRSTPPTSVGLPPPPNHLPPTHIPLQPNLHQGVSVSMPLPPHVPISSNYQTYAPVQLPLNLQTQQPLYSACMQPGLFPPGQPPHPSQIRPTGFPYANL